MIQGTIKGQSLRLSYPTLVADTIAYLEATFVFEGAEWKGLVKWAHFREGNNVFSIELEEDKILAEDHLNLYAGEWEVSLHGDAVEDGETVRRITTQPQKLVVAESGVLDGEPLPIDPPSVGEQILAKAEQALSITGEFQREATEQTRIIEEALDGILAIQEALIGGAGV